MKNLLKNEFKATSRVFLGSYIIFIFMTIIERISLLTVHYFHTTTGFLGHFFNILCDFITALTLIIIIAMLLVPMIYGILRFYKNLLGDEGYLSFTLPVTVSQHIISKLIVICTWTIATLFLVFVISNLFAISFNTNSYLLAVDQIIELFSIGYQQAGFWFILVILLIGLTTLFIPIYQNLNYYCAMSIGQCSNKHKFTLSVVIYFGINFILTITTQLLSIMFIFFITTKYENEVNNFLIPNATLNNTAIFCKGISCLLLINIVYYFVLSLIFFFVTKHFLTKKLNLA